MKWLILSLLLIGCSDKPLPKVGECYESYFIRDKQGTYEIRLIVNIDMEDEYNEIHYVYNFINNPKFEKEKWYVVQGREYTGQSLDSFHRTSNYRKLNKIKCPW